MTISSFPIIRLLAIILGAIQLMQAVPAFAQASPSAYTSAVRYDAVGRTTGTIAPDPDGAGPLHFAAVRNTYDIAGRLIKVEQGELATWQSEAVAPASWSGFTVLGSVETVYDQMGRKVRESAKGSDGLAISLTQYSYDLAGRLSCTATRMNSAVYGSVPASACTAGTEGAGGPDRISRTVYDAAGQVLQRRVGVGSTVEAADVTYAYNLSGQITIVVDANGNRADYHYDGHGRQDRWTFPSTSRPAAYNDATPASALASAGAVSAGDYEAYGYDANGNRTSFRKRDGSTLNFTYDAANRMTVKVVPERVGLAATHSRDVYYGYDLRGVQTTARFDSVNGEGVSSAYDGFGRQVSSSITMDGVSRTLGYLRDRNGNRTQLSSALGVSSYGYDGLSRLTTIHAGAIGTTAVLASYAYTNRATLSSQTTAGGVTTNWGYDPAGRANMLSHNLGGSAHDVTWSLGRNPAGQIIESGRTNDAYAYMGIVNVTRFYTANGLNQYSAAGPASFTYDANGNLTSDGATTYTYDVENRLVGAAGLNSAALRYDPLGRLYETAGGAAGITRFLYDGDELIAEYNGANALLRSYLHGASADDPVIWYEAVSNQLRWLHSDTSGSIVAISDGAGTMVAINAYDEYGIPAATNMGRFGFTGQAWLPELGMFYYKARIYSPTLGRFLQVDPIGYADQFNLYAYVGNDPVNARDPSGTLARGNGWTEKEWKRFDRAQQRAATRMEGRAKRLEQRAARLEGGKRPDPNGAARLRDQASSLRAGASELRNTGDSAAVANLLSEADYSALGRQAGSRAFTNFSTRVVNFSRGVGVLGGAVLSPGWIISHESLHLAGLRDFTSGGVQAYAGGSDASTSLLQTIRGTAAADRNPDSILGGVF